MNLNYRKLLGIEPNKKLFAYGWVGNEEDKEEQHDKKEDDD